MKIGTVELKNITISAPLAGISNLPFRLLVKKFGCALVCSEMISAHGLVYQSRKTADLMNSSSEEKPLSIQIFGSDPVIMAEAASIAEASNADILDINFGCSVKKILKSGSGAALMKTPEKAESVLKAVRKSVSIPLTIKIRTGWDTSGAQALNIVKIAQECGVDAVAIHPRTAGQGFNGKADWSVIKAVKQNASIPVIGNGDITSPDDAIKMLDETGCDAVMIGRVAMGNPQIFAQILARLEGRPDEETKIEDIQEIMLKFLQDSVRYFGETQACRMMRSRLGWFVRGFEHSSMFRSSIRYIETEAQAKELIDKYMLKLKADS